MKGLTVRGWDTRVGCHAVPVSHVVVRNSTVDAQGARTNPMYMTNVQYVTLSGLTIGNVRTGETEISNAAPAPCPHNDHLTFEHTTWHDFLNPNGGSDHMECLQFDALKDGTSNDNVILRGNRFLNCGQYDVFISGPMTNWQVTNNFFDAPCSKQRGTACLVAGGAISFSEQYTNVVGRFNQFDARTYPQFSLLDGAHSGGLWQYNLDGSFPDRGHCGDQGDWRLDANLDSGRAVCPGNAPAAAGARIVLIDSAANGRAVRVAYGVLADRGVHVRLTFYRGPKKVGAVRDRRLVSILSSPVDLVWRAPAKSPPTRVCLRADAGSARGTCSTIR